MEKIANDWKQPEVIVLDVYETILDMSDVERMVNLLTDSKRGYTIWFELFMEYCFVNNSLNDFHDFVSIAKATLVMTGRRLGKTLSESDLNEILELLKHLPVQDEVQEGLSSLSSHDYRLAALTNSPLKIVGERMERTGLISYFEMLLSAEEVKKYKPAKEVYDWAAKKLNTDVEKIMMVSAHSWDIAGAVNAGMQTTFIKKNSPYPLMPNPDFVCRNLSELATMLEERASNIGKQRQ
jgi:2-haloacid dehalogenase